MEWNREEWQVRTKEKVERNYKTFYLFINILFVSIIGTLLISGVMFILK